MRIAIISEYNKFTTIGGTEYYVDLLIQGLCMKNHEVIFITKGKGNTDTEQREVFANELKSYYVYFIRNENYSSDAIKQKEVSSSWTYIQPVLNNFNPDIIHLHTSTTFFNIRHLELCKKEFGTVFFTTHVPGHFCAKGDLIQNNTVPCNGKIGLKCNACMFTKSFKAGAINLIKQYSQKKLEDIALLNKLDIFIISTSFWQQEQLIANGYSAKKLAVIRQAINIPTGSTEISENIVHEELIIGYLGRLSPEKGSALLLNLIKELKDRKGIKFLLAIPLNSNHIERIKLNKILDATNAVELLENINEKNKDIFFNRIDVLLVPSFCVETGPIVLLESLQFNKVVIAPDTGGPVEFAKEFPNNVLLYQWNKKESIISLIDKLQHDKPVQHFSGLKVWQKRLNDFWDKHIELYEMAYNKSRIYRGI